MSVSLLRPQVLTDAIYKIGILADAILVLLYIIGARRRGEALEKNFSENLVDSKSCRNFASATPKKGWSEVSDT